MRDRFTYEITLLKQRLQQFASSSRNALVEASNALQTMDTARAQGIIENDMCIDAEEVAIEEECLKLIALYQPVAKDLRLIITILKINTELERVADLSANIARSVISLSAHHCAIPNTMDLTTMAKQTDAMLKGALEAFICHHPEQARAIIQEDDVIDNLNHKHYDFAQHLLESQCPEMCSALDTIAISHALERIADSATNICEDIIYLNEGVIVRHCPQL